MTNNMPEKIWVTREDSGFKPNFRRFHASSLDHGPDYPEYIRADLVQTWNRDLSAAPAGEVMMLATTGGHVGEAIAPNPDDPNDKWLWVYGGFINPKHTPIAWQPLPPPPVQSEGGDG